MSALSDRLATLTPRHRNALKWFHERRGLDIPKPDPVDGIHIFNPQTGIQKPAGWPHAVSIRQTLTSAYDDHAPVIAPDGSWTYRYFQERTDPEQAARVATNRALFANRDDDVPVAVMIQVKAKPGVRYRVWGLAKVTSFHDGYFELQGYTEAGELPDNTGADFSYPLPTSNQVNVAESSLPLSTHDARQRIDVQIVARQGGKAFREAALKRFNAQCVISGWSVTEVLEAAHVVPYLGIHTNSADNALLLRADIHTLFDRDLVTIDPITLCVKVDLSLNGMPYDQYNGKSLSALSCIDCDTLKRRLNERTEAIEAAKLSSRPAKI